MKKIIILLLLIFIGVFQGYAQSTISGVLKDEKSNEALYGATVVIKGTNEAAATDFDGKFKIVTNHVFPLTISVSFIGYNNKEIVVNKASENLIITLQSNETMLKAVEVSDIRISEKQKQAALTVEAMDLIAIKEVAAGSFYEGLANMKGVDINAASLGFKVINTRGFNSTSPVRSLQLIDGVDNQSPGLNFSLGNFLGTSELDVMKVDIIAGASSAFYGPNAFNGVINMTTKNPWQFKGLSAMAKVGERNLNEYAIRWADVVKNKKGEEKFAYKFNIYTLKAYDWEATNYSPTIDSKTGINNPGGYDAVNIYGDEALGGSNDYTSYSGQINYPGLGVIYRNGYKEIDLVDYNTENIKTQASLHYKINEKVEAIVAGNYSRGSTIYQGDNRYALKNIQFYQARVEVRQNDKFFIRAYTTGEDAGESYDIVQTAFKISTASKPDIDWFKRYQQYWASNVRNNIRGITGFPKPPGVGQVYDTALAQTILSQYPDLINAFHYAANLYANQSTTTYPNSEYELGTPQFDSVFNSITARRFNENGSKFYDRSKLYHISAEYKFTPEWLDIIVGGNARWFLPNSKGTIFRDTLLNRYDTLPGKLINDNASFRKIENFEFGAYTGIEKKLWNEKLKTTVTLRMDKNENFNYIFSPALSAVYNPIKDNTLRISFSSALRNPTLADQYLYYNVGRAILLGNLGGINNLVTVSSLKEYIDKPQQDSTLLKRFNVAAIRPEKVKTIEIGYRSIIFNKIFVDAGYYYSFYTDFIGYKIGVDLKQAPYVRVGPGTQIYRVAANADGLITSQGLSIGLNYYFATKLALNTNYSWNVLNLSGKDDQIIPAFNTPENKFNIGINGRDLVTDISWGKIIKGLPDFSIKHWGFNINYKWVQGYTFTGSPQFTGYLPTYDMVDAQINLKVPLLNCTFKLGASNLMGLQQLFDNTESNFSKRIYNAFKNKPYQVFGGPAIGRLAYFSILFEWNKK
ncbi:MAG: TonB-dependent receptor [Bacteroidia bacterium]|nr:TonB-dependent receptor [Bacteroidia bacterium]MCZ2247362.1 TonB-dependent receptor [Bacteroidia bacterium]